MGVTPDNLLLDRPFKSLVEPPPKNPLEALQRALNTAWLRATGGAGAGGARGAAARRRYKTNSPPENQIKIG